MSETAPQIVEEIAELKMKRNAVILAHNYQRMEVQKIGDFIGDSLDLSRKASRTDSDVIVFCGVYFMAESAKILSPKKTVLLPEMTAGCILADSADPWQLKKLKKAHPDAAVVSYINCYAEIKALSDICCTSANALKVVESLPHEEVIMLPDKNLASWVQKQTKKNIIKWDGVCCVHDRIKPEEVISVKNECPNAVIIAHPECSEAVVELADYVTGTTGMLNLAAELKEKEMIIITEIGLVERLRELHPDKIFHTVKAGMVCKDMKITTLESVRKALLNLEYPIEVEEEIRIKAFEALDKMLNL
jgi:quinolinate synthase